MNDRPKYWYRDIMDNSEHWTQLPFVGWERGGPLNAWYAVFLHRNYRETLIPRIPPD